MSELYIGLMSGTSLDGIDAGLVDFSNDKISLTAFHYEPFSAAFRQKIHNLSQPDQAVLLKNYGAIDSQLGDFFAEAALALLDKAQTPPSAIRAIGSHGQTVYHAPEPPYGFSLQIGDPNRIAEITGITTIADFRRRDIAAGGQGAPLVPAFHQAIFAEPNRPKTVLNIGGIANLTVLTTDNVIGFDTGPGNTLMDFWCQQHINQSYDRNGEWASSGRIIPDLLDRLLDDEFFRRPPPKSTGKEYFSPAWLQQKLSAFSNAKPEDVQATLCHLSADSIVNAIHQHAPLTLQTLVCGGGTHNGYLLGLLEQKLKTPLSSTAESGINPDHVEAIAFAWLARQTLHKHPGNLCKVTGAKTPVILGGIYLGRNDSGVI